MAINEVIRHEQHLRANQLMAVKLHVVLLHQSALPRSSKCLQSQHVGGPLTKFERRNTARNCARGDYQNFMMIFSQSRNLIA